MESCEVLIVGGGPAGSSCAWALKRAGVDVVVLDRSFFPRDKVCAGWITPQVIETLAIDTGDFGRRCTFQPITGFSTGIIGGQPVETRYDRPVSYGIRRSEFDHYLLQRAGARLKMGQPFESMVRTGDRWIVNGSIDAAVIVGAGGHFCPVARLLGGAPGARTGIVSAQEIEFEMSAREAAGCGISPERPELFFCSDLKGYGWCFRKGDYLNVGLGREDNFRLADHVAGFCRWQQARGKIPRAELGRFKGHAYLLYPRAPRGLVADGVILIGDAAGLAYAESGEGIRPAVESGLIAAEVITAAAGCYRRDDLDAYRTRLMARLGPRGAHAQGRSAIPATVRNAVGRRLMRSSWFSRHMLLDRWFLHVDTPALAPG